MAGLDVSWTQDEWAEFLANECRIKRDKASQIASKLAEQDFQTGKFESVVSEWQLNAKGCKEILLGIGFKEMDIFPFIAALRRHIEKEGATNEKQTQTTTHLANRKRPMCNELVWAVCKGIGVVKTSDRILLTSANIYAYLEKAFRKKLIYRDAISFLKENSWSKFRIVIDQLEKNDEDEVVVSQRIQFAKAIHLFQQIDQEQTEFDYELRTNRLLIYLSLSEDTDLVIDKECFGNSHVHFFLQLIAPQLHPLVLNLTEFDDSTFSSAARFLHKIHDSIVWVHLNEEQLSLEPINGVLSKCNKLAIFTWDGMDAGQMRQFCDSFIRWINANNNGDGKPKMCGIQYHHNTILRLLDAIKKDFAGATHKRPIAMRIEDTAKTLTEFTLSNARTREQLQLRRTDERRYILIRKPVMELDIYNHKQLEWEFDNVGEMDSITLKV